MKPILIAVTLMCSLTLFGCANNKARIETDLARMQKDLSDLRSIQAEHTTVVASLRNDMRVLSGRIEEIEYSQNRLSALKQDLSSLQQRVPPPKDVPLEALEADEAFISRLALDSADLLKRGLQAVRLGNYSDARDPLQRLLEISSGQDWAPIPLFWLGVCYELSAETDKAITAYHDLSSTYPKHPRAPLAVLREALTFLKLGDRDTARLALKKILAVYPQSKEAPIAKQKLQGF